MAYDMDTMEGQLAAEREAQKKIVTGRKNAQGVDWNSLILSRSLAVLVTMKLLNSKTFLRQKKKLKMRLQRKKQL